MIATRCSIVVGCVAVLLVGCPSKPVPVSGKVTRAGAPLPAGYITFEPDAASGTTGPGATTTISDGVFTMPPNHALTPGKYLVRIGPPLLGSGMDAKLAATAFKPWESTAEIPSGGAALTFEVPVDEKQPDKKPGG
ncbi:MAG: hypothetical protein U0792_21755 [Gemmataceae bacterium]